MQIFWDDVNRAQEMGKHFCTKLNTPVFVGQHQIDNWKRDPRGSHKLVRGSDQQNPVLYALGEFHRSK